MAILYKSGDGSVVSKYFSLFFASLNHLLLTWYHQGGACRFGSDSDFMTCSTLDGAGAAILVVVAVIAVVTVAVAAAVAVVAVVVVAAVTTAVAAGVHPVNVVVVHCGRYCCWWSCSC